MENIFVYLYICIYNFIYTFSGARLKLNTTARVRKSTLTGLRFSIRQWTEKLTQYCCSCINPAFATAHRTIQTIWHLGWYWYVLLFGTISYKNRLHKLYNGIPEWTDEWTLDTDLNRKPNEGRLQIDLEGKKKTLAWLKYRCISVRNMYLFQWFNSM